jgi:hypothetical protein
VWFSVLPVATPEQLPNDDVRPDAVVHPLSRAAERPCARPGCPSPARATLTFAYAQREAWIERLQERVEPQAYDLCANHASRTRPPHGWSFRDRRPEEERRIGSPPVTPADLGGERTVAVLAAALRAVPDVVPESDVRSPLPYEDVPEDAGATAAASALQDAPVAAGSTLESDPEDGPSPVLGADRTSPAVSPPGQFPFGEVAEPAMTVDEDEPATAGPDPRAEPDAARAPAPEPRPPLALRGTE